MSGGSTKAPKKPKGLLVSLNLVRKVKELPCRVCRAPGPNLFDQIEAKDPLNGEWLNHLWSLCSVHKFERRHVGLKEFVKRHNLPVSWKKGYPELVLTHLEQWSSFDTDE